MAENKGTSQENKNQSIRGREQSSRGVTTFTLADHLTPASIFALTTAYQIASLTPLQRKILARHSRYAPTGFKSGVKTTGIQGLKPDAIIIDDKTPHP